MSPFDTTTALGLLLDWLVSTFPASPQQHGAQGASNLFTASAPLGMIGCGLRLASASRPPRIAPVLVALSIVSLLAMALVVLADAYLDSLGLPRVSWVALLPVPAIACGLLFGLVVGLVVAGLAMMLLTAVGTALTTLGEMVADHLTRMRTAKAAGRVEE